MEETPMAKTYEQKMKAYKATCINHAHMALVYMNYEINSGHPGAAGQIAVVVARWAFTAYPELREAA
jgi:hypothetical protein